MRIKIHKPVLPSQKHKTDGQDTSNTLAQFPANMAKGDKGGSSSAPPKIAGKGCERKTDKPMIDTEVILE
jgi:hypothetical protein